MRREIGERVDRQHIHPGCRARQAVGAARAHGGAEFLRQAQQPEVVDVHLGAGGLDARPVADAESAVVLGVVDQDIHLAADLGRQHADVFRVGDIERQQGDLGNLA